MEVGAEVSNPRTVKRRPSRARQSDVARQAGVSQATVSMVLGDSPVNSHRVSGRTRRRVLKVADDLGYVIDPVARNLVGGRNQMLGVYTFEPVFPADALDFYQEFLVGIERAAEVSGHDLLLFTSSVLTPQRRGIYSRGVNRLALSDGSILLGRNEDKDEVRRLCLEQFPFVYVGRRDVGVADVWYVTADYSAATQRVIEHLRGLGHNQIAYIGRVGPREPDLDRVVAWQAHSRSLVKGPLVRVEKPIVDDLVRKLTERGITALVLENPESAQQVFDTVEHAGLAVPDDLSIVVLGDDPRTARGKRVWTGFRIPRQAMGQAAVQLLLDRIESDPTPGRAVSLSCPFEPGETATPPRHEGTRW